MTSKKDMEKIDYSLYLVSKLESTSFLPVTYTPHIHISPVYIRLPSVQSLFSIEKNHSHIKSPNELALSYFPPDFHWIPEYPQKNLAYYTNILIQTESIRFNPIFSKTSDSIKLNGNIAYFVNFISERNWGIHHSTLRPFVNSAIPYSYYDYIDAWFKFMLLQTPEFNHFWFLNFDKNFKSTFPLWFLQWWKHFGLILDILPPQLVYAFHIFKAHLNHKDFDPNFPPILHFVKKYRIPWFMRFQYVKREAKIERHWFQAKLWDKSPKIDAIVENVKEMVQIPKAPISLQISPRSAFTRYSNISK
jgi:hypothetical protein